MREFEIARKTKETDIYLKINLDGSGIAEIAMDFMVPVQGRF